MAVWSNEAVEVTAKLLDNAGMVVYIMFLCSYIVISEMLEAAAPHCQINRPPGQNMLFRQGNIN